MINDLLKTYLHARSQRGYGANRIKQELRQLKGVSSDVINEASQKVKLIGLK